MLDDRHPRGGDPRAGLARETKSDISSALKVTMDLMTEVSLQLWSRRPEESSIDVSATPRLSRRMLALD